jgi:hypothetical protein
MNDHQLKQRIAYLVEHGGLFDDPIADLRRNVRLLFVMNALACTFGIAGLVLLVTA